MTGGGNLNTLESTSTTTTSPWLIVGLVLVLVVLFLVIRWFYSRRQRGQLLKEVEMAKSRVFLKITVPKEQRVKEDENKDYRELLSVFEPFLSALAGLYQKGSPFIKPPQPIFSLEIVAKKGEIFFYLSCEPTYKETLERQIHSQYPAAQIEQATDFQLFDGQEQPYEAANLQYAKPLWFPLKTYRYLELDPLNGLTNALSKLSEQSRGAVQLLLKPADPNWQKSVSHSLEQLAKGQDVSKKAGGSVLEMMGEAGKQLVSGPGKKDDKEPAMASPHHQQQIEIIKEKVAKQGLEVELRAVVTAPTETEAVTYINTLLAAFGQFNSPDRNSFKIGKKRPERIMKDYLLRRFSNSATMVMNTEEIASIFHLPNRNIDTPNIHWLAARKLGPPINLPLEGIKIGESVFRGETKQINILPGDRLRHLYMIGKTGVGKTVLFENMIEQDIKSGSGVAYLDPNGDAIEWILGRIPKERSEDIIYFNPADTARPFGLNLLEWKRPEERDFLIQEAISIFYKLFDPGKTGIVGPQFEHWFRNAALTLMADPEGGTLVELPRLFVDDAFMATKVAHVTDPVVRTFWEKQMAQTSAASKSEMLNYFISKFGRFMTNDLMRNIIGQTKSSFDFREVMDSGKILLVNLSKGLIGDINSQLLGMILVTKLQMAAFSRQDQTEEERRPFYLYVDEFQNFTTDTFTTILSEARKYRLALNITNQYIAQLEEPIRDAVMGNIGTMICFRIGAADTEIMLREFEGLSGEDLINTEKQHFYLKMLIDNAPTPPFTGRSSLWSPDGNRDLAVAYKELSRLKFGQDVKKVSAEILARSRLDEIPIPQQNDPNAIRS